MPWLRKSDQQKSWVPSLVRQALGERLTRLCSNTHTSVPSCEGELFRAISMKNCMLSARHLYPVAHELLQYSYWSHHFNMFLLLYVLKMMIRTNISVPSDEGELL